MREHCSCEDNDKGEVECKRRGTHHLSLDDIEYTEGSHYCPHQYKPPCAIVVGMDVVCTLALLHNGGDSHANEYKNVKGENNLFDHFVNTIRSCRKTLIAYVCYRKKAIQVGITAIEWLNVFIDFNAF